MYYLGEHTNDNDENGVGEGDHPDYGYGDGHYPRDEGEGEGAGEESEVSYWEPGTCKGFGCGEFFQITGVGGAYAEPDT